MSGECRHIRRQRRRREVAIFWRESFIFLTEDIMVAQNFNPAAKLLQMLYFQPQILYVWKKNLWQVTGII